MTAALKDFAMTMVSFATQPIVETLKLAVDTSVHFD